MTEDLLSGRSRRVLLADAGLLLVAFIWGLGIPISADMVRSMPPLWSNALRMICAGICSAVVFSRRLRAATPHDWRCGAVIAAFVTGTFALTSFALLWSTASKQSFIIATQALMIPFIAWAAYRRRPSGFVFAGAALGTAGMMLMGSSPGMTFNAGDLLSVLMCLVYSCEVVTIEYCARTVDPTTLVATQMPIVGAMMTAVAFAAEGSLDLSTVPTLVWGEILFTGVVNTVFCYLVQTVALKHTSSSHAGLLLSLESVFGYVIAVASGQDQFVARGAIGGAIVMAGVLVAESELFVRRAHQI